MQLQPLRVYPKILDTEVWGIDSRGIVERQWPDYGYRGSSLQQHGGASGRPHYPLDPRMSGAE